MFVVSLLLPPRPEMPQQERKKRSSLGCFYLLVDGPVEVLVWGKQGKSGVEKMSEERVEVGVVVVSSRRRKRKKKKTPLTNRASFLFLSPPSFSARAVPHDPTSGSATPLLRQTGGRERHRERGGTKEGDLFLSLCLSLSPTIGRRSVFFFFLLSAPRVDFSSLAASSSRPRHRTDGSTAASLVGTAAKKGRRWSIGGGERGAQSRRPPRSCQRCNRSIETKQKISLASL